MHSRGVCHRDLKPENILIKFDSNSQNNSDPLSMKIKIADVGSSKTLAKGSKPLNTPYIVSRYFRGPELILGTTKYDLGIDAWAAGCILFELLSRTPLFPGEEEGNQILEY